MLMAPAGPGLQPARSLIPPCTRLQDYLETKRIAFPRFYFVAPADLLDILARGSNPQAVVRCVAVRVRAVRACTARMWNPATLLPCHAAVLLAGTYPNVLTTFTTL